MVLKQSENESDDARCQEGNHHPLRFLLVKALTFSWNFCFENSSMEVTHGLSLNVSEYERGPIYVSKTKSKVVDRSSRQ